MILGLLVYSMLDVLYKISRQYRVLMLAEPQHGSDFACSADIKGIPTFSTCCNFTSFISNGIIVSLSYYSLNSQSIHWFVLAVIHIPVNLLKEIRKGEERTAGTFHFLK